MAEKRKSGGLAAFLLSAGLVVGASEYANAQQAYQKVPLTGDLKSAISRLSGIDSLVITKEQFEKLPASEMVRYSPLYFVSKDGKERTPMYALPGFYESLHKSDLLYLKRAVQEPIGFFVKDSTRSPVYVIEDKGSKFLYFGPAEKILGVEVPRKEIKPEVKKPKYEPRKKPKKPIPEREEKKPGELEKKVEEEPKAPEFKVEVDTLTAKVKERKRREERPFMEISGDTLRLFEPYDSLTCEQKKEFLEKYREFLQRGKIKKIAPQTYVVTPRIKIKKEKKEIEELETRFGLQGGFGTNSEAVAGLFVDVPLASWLSAEVYADGYPSYLTRKDKGLPVFTKTIPGASTTERQFRADGSQKFRTDRITENVEERAVAEAGLKAIVKCSDYFEIPLGAGVVATEREKRLDGEATIRFERNGQPLGAPQTITNSKYKAPTVSSVLDLSAGARFNLTKNLGVEVSANKIGQVKGGRITARMKF